MKQNEQSENGHKRFLFVKKRLKRAAALAGILIISLSLSGCKNFVETDVGAGTKITNQTVCETINSESITEIKTIEPPEDGLTFDDINIIEINGKQVSLPFKVEELGEDYSIDKEVWTGGSENILKYNNNYIACIDIDEDKEITSIKITDDEMKQYKVKICNLDCQNNFGEIIKKLGEPYDSSEFVSYEHVEYLLYKYSNAEIFITSTDYQNGFNYVSISYIN